MDLFAGAAGWEEGIRDLGLDVLGIELNADACATREAAGHRTLQADVSALDPLDFAPCGFLIGSPPCPTFSSAGNGNGHVVTQVILRCASALTRGEDVRAACREEAYVLLYPSVLAVESKRAAKKRKPVDLAKVETKARRDATMSLLVVEPLRWALALRPELIALEQVPGVLPLWQMFGEMLRGVGYSVWAGKLSSETFGVSQTRERAILMASLTGPVAPPQASHQAYEYGIPAQEIHTLEGTLQPWVCMADALGWGMTERPSTTLTAGSNRQGGSDPLDGGSGSRASLEREREREAVGFRLHRGAGMTDRHGERRDTPSVEPAPVITSKARTATWVVTGQNSAQAGGATELFARSTDEPSPTVTGTVGRWSYERRQGKTEPGGARRMSPLRPDTEPAPTIGGEGLAKSRDRWVYVNGNQENAARRPSSAPAPTVHFGAAINDVKWVEERPAPTLVTTRRSKDGLLVGRQMAEGEGENVGGHGWASERPATTLTGDERCFGPHSGSKGESHSQNAVRVTIEEAALLQSFPADYPWQGSRTAKFTQIGNAVPPLMARAVITALLATRKQEAA